MAASLAERECRGNQVRRRTSRALEWQLFVGCQMIQSTLPTEEIVRIIGAVVVVWLIIGAIAAGQRGYYKGSSESCAKTGTVVVTVVAGPLNYVGANPKVKCVLPRPSK
jgi:hypothetical protein